MLVGKLSAATIGNHIDMEAIEYTERTTLGAANEREGLSIKGLDAKQRPIIADALRDVAQRAFSAQHEINGLANERFAHFRIAEDDVQARAKGNRRRLFSEPDKC